MQDQCAPIATPVRQVKLAGYTIQVSDSKPTFWARVCANAWEPGALAAIAAHVRPETWFLDLGAWVGPTTLLAARLGARCIAVEADPQALRELRGNLACNAALAARVSVVDRAVSPTSAPVTLAARRKPGDSMSSALLAEQTDARRVRWRVEAITPAQLAASVPAEAPLFIKLDIEGGEFALLPHMAPLLRRRGPTRVLASFHPGVLRETGVPEDDIRARTALALAPFAGWRGAEIDPLAGREGDGAPPDAALIANGQQSDSWMFTRQDARTE